MISFLTPKNGKKNITPSLFSVFMTIEDTGKDRGGGIGTRLTSTIQVYLQRGRGGILFSF